jgi:hypothetical protein
LLGVKGSEPGAPRICNVCLELCHEIIEESPIEESPERRRNLWHQDAGHRESGPLDDALARQDRERQQQQQKRRDDQKQMESLINEFLRRMNAVDNPGQVRVSKLGTGHYRLSRGWEIVFKTGTSEYIGRGAGDSLWKQSEDRFGLITLFPGGKITVWTWGNGKQGRWYQYVPYTEADLSCYGQYIDAIAGAMAEIMRKHGVR